VAEGVRWFFVEDMDSKTTVSDESDVMWINSALGLWLFPTYHRFDFASDASPEAKTLPESETPKDQFHTVPPSVAMIEMQGAVLFTEIARCLVNNVKWCMIDMDQGGAPSGEKKDWMPVEEIVDLVPVSGAFSLRHMPLMAMGITPKNAQSDERKTVDPSAWSDFKTKIHLKSDPTIGLHSERRTWEEFLKNLLSVLESVVEHESVVKGFKLQELNLQRTRKMLDRCTPVDFPITHLMLSTLDHEVYSNLQRYLKSFEASSSSSS
jgi:hypothetical protein